LSGLGRSGRVAESPGEARLGAPGTLHHVITGGTDRREISFIPELAAKECWNCKDCFPLCPTSAAPATYVPTTAFAPPDPSLPKPHR